MVPELFFAGGGKNFGARGGRHASSFVNGFLRILDQKLCVPRSRKSRRQHNCVYLRADFRGFFRDEMFTKNHDISWNCTESRDFPCNSMDFRSFSWTFMKFCEVPHIYGIWTSKYHDKQQEWLLFWGRGRKSTEITKMYQNGEIWVKSVFLGKIH